MHLPAFCHALEGNFISFFSPRDARYLNSIERARYHSSEFRFSLFKRFLLDNLPNFSKPEIAKGVRTSIPNGKWKYYETYFPGFRVQNNLGICYERT